MKNHRRFNKVKVTLPFFWYSELNVVRAGESAFKIGVKFYNNPFKDNPFHSWWIRGFKRAERQYAEAMQRSLAIQQTIGLEEVED